MDCERKKGFNIHQIEGKKEEGTRKESKIKKRKKRQIKKENSLK
jgi:hypothetical protein